MGIHGQHFRLRQGTTDVHWWKVRKTRKFPEKITRKMVKLSNLHNHADPDIINVISRGFVATFVFTMNLFSGRNENLNFNVEIFLAKVSHLQHSVQQGAIAAVGAVEVRCGELQAVHQSCPPAQWLSTTGREFSVHQGLGTCRNRLFTRLWRPFLAVSRSGDTRLLYFAVRKV